MKYILTTLNYPQRDIELGQIAGYLHDIGNIVNRVDHAHTSAIMVFTMLNKMDCDPIDITAVITAIGNHDEHTSIVADHLTAALILGDKTDIRRNRARKHDFTTFDIHDRVNYSAEHSMVEINKDHTEIALKLVIDTQYCSVMEYFQIFLERMVLCCEAAVKINMRFKLIINDQILI
jgi:metal-dependent HD superfamily phosphatase/phosphodiesterase